MAHSRSVSPVRARRGPSGSATRAALALGALLAAACGGGGGAKQPAMTLSPGSLTFVGPYVGATYAQTFAIQNGGGGALRVTGVAADAAATAAGYTVVAPGVPFDVAPGASASVTVRLTKRGNGVAAGAVLVQSNDPTSPSASVALTSTSSGAPLLSVCALQGAAVEDGCSVDGEGKPLIDAGTITRGGTARRVVALSNGGTGDQAVELTAADFEPAAASGYALELFTLDGGTEVPATLPFLLTGADPMAQLARNELRVRVTVTAPQVEGALSGVGLALTAGNLAPPTVTVPVVAQVTGCPAGMADCDGTAANGCETAIATDLANCGACGAVCGAENGAPTCVDGACALHCAAGYASCDGGTANGCETSLTTDVANCGACGTACTADNAAGSCDAGTCRYTCLGGHLDCDGSTANGCEVAGATDTANCGACGHACPVPAHAAATCGSGTCGFACADGWADCDGDPANGCEVDLRADPDHCGACATACSGANQATRTCTAGACSGSCAAGFADCNGNLQADGCETDLNTSVGSCGTCGHACDATNGTPSCAAGACQIACNGGWANCDGSVANGCETDLTTSVGDCGSCGHACDATNGTPSCVAGACQIACNPGWGSCDGAAANGCETDVTSSVGHCGTCGHACDATNGTPSCAAGACQIACNGGWASCDGSAANGCETDLGTSVANCGGCGNACDGTNGTPSCASGLCQISCNPGWGNCDGSALNGCETSVSTDPNACGGCGQPCSANNMATRTCTAGACTGACAPGYDDCNGNKRTDGCETNLLTAPYACGACGNDCNAAARPNVSSAACAAGSCAVGVCAAGYYDVNGLFGDGCECQGEAAPDTCSTATSLGTINLGGAVGPAGNLVPASDEDWYVVTFGGAGSCSFHPFIAIASDPSSLIRFDVLTGCGQGGVGCSAEGGSSVGLTSWEQGVSGWCAWYQPQTFVIRVYAIGSNATCLPYSLNVHN